MAYRTPARWLAPLALLGAALAILVTVASGGGEDGGAGSSSSSATRSTTTAATGSSTGTTAARTTPGPKTYTVQPGDVLSGIAAKTGVELSRIEELNPGLDAQTLRVGQSIKLAP